MGAFAEPRSRDCRAVRVNGRKFIPGLDEYDNGETPTVSVWDEFDQEESATAAELDADDE